MKEIYLKGKIKYNNNKLLINEFKIIRREGEGIIKFKNNEDYIKIKFKDGIIIQQKIYYFIWKSNYKNIK